LWKCNVYYEWSVTEDRVYSRIRAGYYDDLEDAVRNLLMYVLVNRPPSDLVRALTREVAGELRVWTPPSDKLHSLACVNFDEGLVLVVDATRPVDWRGAFRVVFCNVSELSCLDIPLGYVNEVLIAPVLARVARRMARSGEHPVHANYLEEITRFIEEAVVPLLRLSMGVEVGWEDVLRAVGRLADRYPHHSRLIIELMPELTWRLGLDDGRRLVEAFERAVEASKIDERVDRYGYAKLLLELRRADRNSALAGVAGKLCKVEYPGDRKLHEPDVVEVSIFCEQFENRRLFDIVTRALRRLGITVEMFDTIYIDELLWAIKHFDKPDQFEGFTREDLFRLVEATLEAVVESMEGKGIVSRTAMLSDGRKLHVIVYGWGWLKINDRFIDAILMLSNHEIKATYVGDLITTKRFENNEEVIEHIIGMSSKDIAKLDEETRNTIRNLMIQRATLSD